MSRFLLDDETIKRISEELPDFDEMAMTVMKLAPDLISAKYDPHSNVPVAAVCLRDALNVLLQIRIGLNECLQHKIWYREKSEPPSEQLAVIFMRFYIDGMVSRLYAAGEHLANAIISMLEISEEQLSKYRKNRVSQQSIIGHYLINEKRDHIITKAVHTLISTDAWNKTIQYRNDVVHEQPPTVSGLGTVYSRKRRWVKSESEETVKLSLGGGDEPDYSIDEVLDFVKPSIFEFISLFEVVVDFYVDLIGKRSIDITDRGISMNLLSFKDYQ